MNKVARLCPPSRSIGLDEERRRTMRVKVRPINVAGRPLFARERERREVFAGELKVMENRIHPLGRVVTTARVIDTVDNVESTLIELYDVTLLWIDGRQMRLRGFEDVEGVQYGQTWDVEMV